MTWGNPHVLWLLAPVCALAWWAARASQHPMGPARRRATVLLRWSTMALVLAALGRPGWRIESHLQTVIVVVDGSMSMGQSGRDEACRVARVLADGLAPGTQVGVIGAAGEPRLILAPAAVPPDLDAALLEAGREPADAAATDLGAAVSLATGVFPEGRARRVVLLSDGLETRGSLETEAAAAAIAGVTIDIVPIGGDARPDVRLLRLRASRSRSREGAPLTLTAEIESTLATSARLRFFENGIEVSTREIQLAAGETSAVDLERTPAERGHYRYLARLEHAEGDSVPDNNEAQAVVDVRGRPVLLHVEGEPREARYLVDAMAEEGLRLVSRPPAALPTAPEELLAYDGVILSDVPARDLPDGAMEALVTYVEELGGGLIMIGGQQSFGPGAYSGTPLAKVLPVRLEEHDVEERDPRALMLVLDRSGSMGGQKIQLCKAAAVGAAELLAPRDYLGVVAFDSQAHWLVPLEPLGDGERALGRIESLTAGGGTAIHPGMSVAGESLRALAARRSHMIVLTDGHSGGPDPVQLAELLHSAGITISGVGVGAGADMALLQSIARSGGGECYQTLDPSQIPRIFVEDTITHMQRLLEETTFEPVQLESHPMLEGWHVSAAPPLLGHVRTQRRASAQLPLVTPDGDPLLAHWRYGLGKVTAFTSDCKSRWSALWISAGDVYGQFWGQVLREMAREPQGRHLDLRLESRDRELAITADLLEDAGHWEHAAEIGVEMALVRRGSLSGALEELGRVELTQVAPGRYAGVHPAPAPGLYLARARAGADLVSAAIIHDVATETTTGRIDPHVLERAAALTGGEQLDLSSPTMPTTGAARVRTVDLTGALVLILIPLLLSDLALRRWQPRGAR